MKNYNLCNYNSIKVQLDDQYATVLSVPVYILRENSSMFDGLLASYNQFHEYPSRPVYPIKLKIKNLQSFLVILEYLQTKRKDPAMEDTLQFVKFIPEVMYLGIEKLEQHLIFMFEKALETTSIWDELDMLKIPQDFLETFLREKAVEEFPPKKAANLVFFILKWAKVWNFGDENTVKMLEKISMETLNFEELKKFADMYPQVFNLAVKPTTVMASCFTTVMAISFGRMGVN